MLRQLETGSLLGVIHRPGRRCVSGGLATLAVLLLLGGSAAPASSERVTRTARTASYDLSAAYPNASRARGILPAGCERVCLADIDRRLARTPPASGFNRPAAAPSGSSTRLRTGGVTGICSAGVRGRAACSSTSRRMPSAMPITRRSCSVRASSTCRRAGCRARSGVSGAFPAWSTPRTASRSAPAPTRGGLVWSGSRRRRTASRLFTRRRTRRRPCRR